VLPGSDTVCGPGGDAEVHWVADACPLRVDIGSRGAELAYVAPCSRTVRTRCAISEEDVHMAHDDTGSEEARMLA
jgi:hypothetical protein